MILYWISRLAYVVQQRFRQVKYITLVNLLSAADPLAGDATPYDPERRRHARSAVSRVPDLQRTSRGRSPAHVIGWLTDRAERERLVERLSQLKAEVAHGGAARSAAEYILADLARRPQPIPAPHYTPAGLPRRCPENSPAKQGCGLTPDPAAK